MELEHLVVRRLLCIFSVEEVIINGLFSQEISCFDGFIPSRDNVKTVELKTTHFYCFALMEKFSLKNAERNFYKAINLCSFAQLKAVAHESYCFLSV